MLTDRQIQTAIKSCTSETVLRDGAGGRGTGSLTLVIRRLASGSSSAQWVGQWKTNGQRHKKTLGRYPDMALRDARDVYAGQVRAVLQDGKNPRAMSVTAM